MLSYLVHGIANPIARFWLATSSQSWRNLPLPSDRPLVHAPGPDPDRVLLIGSGVAVGYGVMSHDLALGGHLARELSAQTGRGASVDIVGRSDMSPANARISLAALDLARFDALVLTLGGLEALTLMPPVLWRHQLAELFDELHRLAPARLEVFVVQTAAPLATGLPVGIRSLVLRCMAKINRQTEQLCSEFERARFVSFTPSQSDVNAFRGRSAYHGWAELIAPSVAEVLDSETHKRSPDTVDESQRQRSLDALDIDDVPNDELERIVATARDLFGALGASVTIVDQDVQKTKTAIGMPDRTIARSISICDLTIRRAGLLVVEDMTTDPRLVGSPWADGSRARFYAGYPIESPDGHRIGALCVVDSVPRTFSDTDAALLRQLALRAQSVLWGNRVLG
jgi:GAF domain-containing protein